MKQLDPASVLGIHCDTVQIRYHKGPENSKIGLFHHRVPSNLIFIGPGPPSEGLARLHMKADAQKQVDRLSVYHHLPGFLTICFLL